MAFYFVSDVHAGLKLDGVPTRGEERLIAWLDKVAADAEGIFLLGDIFDFWFEYKRAVPAGHEALLSKFRELTARGISVHFFPGNHDMWTLDYLSRECGLTVHTGALDTTLCGKRIYMEHGDLQSIGSFGERFMQACFRSRVMQWIGRTFVSYRRMMRFGTNWSCSNRAKHDREHVFKKEEEGIVQFAREYLKTHDTDIFIFGHLHCPMEYRLSENAMLYVLGDWILERSAIYGRLDESGFSLLSQI